jgi:hypothetical protein
MLTQLWRSFQEGGWAMWWIFPLGFVAIGAAGRFAWRGEHQLLPFLRWITLTEFLCGCFGSLIGEQKVLRAMLSMSPRVPQDLSLLEQRLWVFLTGTREASNCLSAALMFVVLICLLLAIGLRRFPLPNPGVAAR